MSALSVLAYSGALKAAAGQFTCNVPVSLDGEHFMGKNPGHVCSAGLGVFISKRECSRAATGLTT